MPRAKILHLPEKSDITQAQGLYQKFEKLLESEAPIKVSAKKVQFLDTAILQLLWVVKNECQLVGRAFEIKDVSEECQSMLDIFGAQQILMTES
jgi:ABC-type transporter Mla MlaB component